MKLPRAHLKTPRYFNWLHCFWISSSSFGSSTGLLACLLVILTVTSLCGGTPTPTPSLRSLYLKAIQEPTGKNFRLFKRECRGGASGKLFFEEDPELLQTLKPKKRFIGPQVHALVISYLSCVDEGSKKVLEEIFAKEILVHNLKKFISVSCREKLLEKDLVKILSVEGLPKDKLKKRLKTITIPGPCSDFKTTLEKLIVSESNY